MRYNISYSCVSHVGKVRKMNQDNFICDGRFMEADDKSFEFPLTGVKSSGEVSLFGIFDGMGGEECGEIASYIAAKNAADAQIGTDAVADMLSLCDKANAAICDYAKEHGVSVMGTTAAMLAFAQEGVTLCNIGDSKIFRLRDGIMEQLSEDHVCTPVFGQKPPLLQNLGIPPTEMTIEPYVAKGQYAEGDIYLICSDGLTDMVTVGEITDVLTSKGIAEATDALLEKALSGGGRDNTSIILCQIEREPNGFLKWLKHIQKKEA